MEKQTKSRKKFFCRLLIFFAVLIFAENSLFARRATWDYVHRLKFKKGQEYFFTQEDSPFYIDIEGVNPENVQVSVNSLPENVSFVSYKKEALLVPPENYELTEEFTPGTHIVVYLKFYKTGHYRINPIDVVVNGGFYRLQFESVDVFENPRFVLPKIILKFDDELKNKFTRKNQIEIYSGEHIKFSLSAQYAVSIKDFYWDIPENSLFRQIEVFDFLNAQNNSSNSDFSPDVKPLSTFDWQPLIPGKYSLPKFYISALTYNGVYEALELEDYTIVVKKSSVPFNTAYDVQANPFVYAFAESDSSFLKKKDVNLSEKDFEDLVKAYEAEKFSLPFSNARILRSNLERQFNLKVEKGSPLFFVFCLLLFVFVLTLILTIVFLILKKNPLAVFFGLCTISFCVGLGIYSFAYFKNYAVYKEGILRPIPEEIFDSGITLVKGSKVRVLKSADGWNFIKHNDSTGWVKDSQILRISNLPEKK